MRKALAGVMAGILAAGTLTACGASEPAKMEMQQKLRRQERKQTVKMPVVMK